MSNENEPSSKSQPIKAREFWVSVSGNDLTGVSSLKPIRDKKYYPVEDIHVIEAAPVLERIKGLESANYSVTQENKQIYLMIVERDSKIKELEAENKRHKELNRKLANHNDDYSIKLAKRDEVIKVMREALSFYAEKTEHHTIVEKYVPEIGLHEAIEIHGVKASEALEKADALLNKAKVAP